MAILFANTPSPAMPHSEKRVYYGLSHRRTDNYERVYHMTFNVFRIEVALIANTPKQLVQLRNTIFDDLYMSGPEVLYSGNTQPYASKDLSHQYVSIYYDEYIPQENQR